MPINALASFTPTIPNQDEADAAATSANDPTSPSSECGSAAPSGTQAAQSGAPIAPVDKAGADGGGKQGGTQEHGSSADGGSSLASLRYRAGIDSTMVSAKLADATQAHAQAQSQAQQTGRDTLSLSKGVAQAPDPHGSHLTSDPETAQAQKRQQADQQRHAAELNKNIKDLQALQKAAAQPQASGKTTTQAKAAPQQPDKSNNSQTNPPKAEQQQGWWKSWGSSATHGVLGAASFVPGVSVISGAIDAGIYAAEGDYLNAGLSAASMIPGGKAVTTAGKVIAKGVKVAEEAKTLEKTTKLAEEATKLKNTETLAVGPATLKPAEASTGKVKEEVAALRRIAVNNAAGSPAAELRQSYQQARGQLDFSHAEGEVRFNSKGQVRSATGAHFSTSPKLQIVQGTETVGSNGIIEAKVNILGSDGNFHLKTNNNGFSTLTPDAWSLARAKGEMSRAFLNKTQPTGRPYFEGTSSGVEFRFHSPNPNRPLWTGYPLMP